MAKGWAIPKGRYGEMKIDKFYMKNGYSNHKYREIRSKVNKFLNKDYGIGETVSRYPHKVKKLVRLQHPEQ